MQLTDLPQNIGMKPYEQARDRVRSLYSKIPGVLAVLEFGTIPYPGISDMDFFIIVEPHVPVIFPHFSTYPEEERYAMTHRHYAISRDVFKHLDYIDPWFVHVESLHDPSGGFPFTKGSFSAEGYEALSLNFIHQKLTYGSLLFLGHALSSGTLPVRHFFEEFKLFRYFLREFAKVNAPHREEDPSLDRYDQVAREWFTFSPAEQTDAMRDILERYKDSVLRAYRMLYECVKSKCTTSSTEGYQPKTYAQRTLLRRFPSSFIVDLGENVFVYQRGMKGIRIEGEYSRLSLPLIGKAQRLIHVLPWELGCFATPHLFLQGCASDHFKKLVCTDLQEIPRFENTDLLFLHQVDNLNFFETRNVRNCKYYEMQYGYRPVPDSYDSLMKRLKSIASGALRCVAQSLAQSRTRHLCSRGTTHTVFEASF